MKFSSPYSRFAAAYDQIMENVDYTRWTNYMEDLFAFYDYHPKRVLDLACGTGSVTVPLTQRGYQMWGLDRAEEMLEWARQKAKKTGEHIEFVQGDMRTFTLPIPFDAVLCLYDSINYAANLTELGQVFERVFDVLEPEGLFIFDITTERNIVQHFHFQTFAENEDAFSYIWKNIYSHRDKVCRTFLTFFLKEPDSDSYTKHEEVHIQKIYEVDEVKKLLSKKGFKMLAGYDAFTFNRWHRHSDRINFVARKLSK